MFNNFTKLTINNMDEFYYLRDCGVAVQLFSKGVIQVYNNHYNFSKVLLENKRNPVRFKKKDKK